MTKALSDAISNMLGSAPAAAAVQTTTTAAAAVVPVATSDGSVSAQSSTGGGTNQQTQANGSSVGATTANAANSPSAASLLATSTTQNTSPSAGVSSSDAMSGPALSDGSRMRLVQRVARAFQSAASNDDGSVQLRLSPPELGSLRIEIKMNDGQMSAKLDAETPAARDTLLESLPELRDRLQQQDIKVVRFDVGLMGQSTGGSPHTPNRDSDNSAPGRRNSLALDSATTGDGVGGGSTGSLATGSSGLDVVI